jgi:DNA-binding transcriptional LysR family regulator
MDQERLSKIDLRTLEAFVWISRLGGFTAAAERMNTTQPAISHRIQQLEQQLDVQIFQRRKPKVVLTDRGHELLKYAEPILRMHEHMLAAVGAPDRLPGRLSIGAVESIVKSWLPSFISGFSRSYPNVELMITVDDSPALRGRLLSYEIDLAFIAGTIQDPVIRSEPLSRCRMGFVGAPGLVSVEKLSAEALTKIPLITFSRTSSSLPVLEMLPSQPNRSPPRLHTSNSLATIVQMARDGLGLAFIPLMVAAEDLAAGVLVEVPTHVTIPDITFSACWLAAPEKALAALAAAVAVSSSATFAASA